MKDSHCTLEIKGEDCEICREAMPLEKVFNNNNHCSHPFCTDCITRYIQVKVEENAGDIVCPSLSCKQLLDPIFCSSIIPKSTFERWCDNLCASAVLRTKQRCFCPYPDCSELVLNECEVMDKAECPTCKRNFCFLCKLQWQGHENRNCFEENRHIGDMDDVLFGKLCKEKGWARCFNCGQCVELQQGCRHIVCRCGASFCYYCGVKWPVTWTPHDCPNQQPNAHERCLGYFFLLFISVPILLLIFSLC